MALKAGYKGIKKSVLDSLLSLLGSVVIKDIGDGLALDSDGELAADIDTSTMEFTEEGKLSAKIPSSFKKDLLYGNSSITFPPSTETSITLNEDITDYDYICFVLGFNTTNVLCFSFEWSIAVDDLLQTVEGATSDTAKQLVMPLNTGSNPQEWVRVSRGNADNKLSVRYNGAAGIYKIYGVKF